MKPKIKEFIEKYIPVINNNDFTFLYNHALDELDDESYIGELTFALNQAGIDPLEHMSSIPSDYYNSYPAKSIPPIPSHITAIMSQAFFDSEVTSIRVPGNVTILRETAFDYACELKTVVIEEGVSYIRESCFIDCGSLENVYLPASLITLGNRAFTRCYELKEIHYAGTVDRWKKLFTDNLMFKDSNVTVIHCADGDITL